MELLQAGIAWVVLKFSDNSVQLIRTTLNESILTNYGVKPRVGYFYDLNHGVFVQFREDAIDITVSEQKPEFQDEVINFANRFI